MSADADDLAHQLRKLNRTMGRLEGYIDDIHQSLRIIADVMTEVSSDDSVRVTRVKKTTEEKQ